MEDKQKQAEQELQDKIKVSVIAGLEKTIDRVGTDLKFLGKFRNDHPAELISLQNRIEAIHRTAENLDSKIAFAEKQLRFARKKLKMITELLPVKERIGRLISKLRRLGWTNEQIARLD